MLYKTVLFIVVGLLFWTESASAQVCSGGSQTGGVITNCSGSGTVNRNVSYGNYVLVNVVKGIQYKIQNRGTGNVTIRTADGSGLLYHGLTDIVFTATYSGQIRVYNCYNYTFWGVAYSNQIRINIAGGSNTTDDETRAGTNQWVEHFYAGINFQQYLGYWNRTEPAENFDESFGGGGDGSCFGVYSEGNRRMGRRRRNFSARFLMNSTKRGLYRVDLGSDDGSRLFIDNEKVYDWWSNHGFGTRSNQLISLTGNSQLKYEYFENTGGNRVIFQNFTRLIENTISGTQSICVGDDTPTQITGDNFITTLPSGYTKVGGTGFQWVYSTTSGGATTDIVGATGQNFTPNLSSSPFNTAGTYYVYRKATLSHNNFGVPSPYTATNVSNEVTVTVNPLPTASISISETSGTTNNDGTVCSGDLATLTASGGTSYSWSSGETTASINKGAGTYTVTVTNASGCQSTSSVTITETPLPTANISISETSGTTNNDGIICSGDLATLTASGGTSYSWSSGETTASINKGAGTYTVTVTNASGCQSTSSVTITEIPLPTASISISETSGTTNNDGTVCSGDLATLTASGGTSYSWSSGETTASINKGAGTYTVTVTNASGCQSTSSVTITETPLPNNISTGGFKGGKFCEGEQPTITFNGIQNGNYPYSIVYVDGNNVQHTQPISSSLEQTFDAPNLNVNSPSGTYRYKLISITDANGCTLSESASVPQSNSVFGKKRARVRIRKNPANVVAMSVNSNAVCTGETAPIVTFTNSDTKPIIVTYAINGATSQTIEVPNKVGAINGSATLNVATITAGVYTYNATKVRYKSKPNCEATIDLKECIAVFPKNSTAPIVSLPNNTAIEVTPPATVSGFSIEYSFDDGATWGANTPPITDKCDGYKIKTRYVLANACGSAVAGSTISCAVSPATIRVVDTTAPTFDVPPSLSVCVNNIQSASYNTATNDIAPVRPDYYEIVVGSTELNLTNLSDNCCNANDLTINWNIDGTTYSGTGQASNYSSIIRLELGIDKYAPKTYTVKYTVKDCNNNTSDEKTTTITIKPRPKIEKLNN